MNVDAGHSGNAARWVGSALAAVLLLLLAGLPAVVTALVGFEGLADAASDVAEASFEGPRRDGVAHGRGRMAWPDGRVYEGRFRGGLPDGNGTLLWPDGRSYEGRFEAGRIQGEGRIEFVDGRNYVGELANGRPHGLGTLRWPDRTRFTGEYEAGSREGWGEYRTADGERYVGGYADDVRAGQGTLIGADGTLYRGGFRSDARQGYGVRVSPNGSSLTLEFWENGVRESSESIRRSGNCRLDHARRRWMVRGSTCVDGLAHGRGRAVSVDGTLFVEEGRFVLGRLVEGRALALGQPPEEGS